jgi:hypothetical protein
VHNGTPIPSQKTRRAHHFVDEHDVLEAARPAVVAKEAALGVPGNVLNAFLADLTASVSVHQIALVMGVEEEGVQKGGNGTA